MHYRTTKSNIRPKLKCMQLHEWICYLIWRYCVENVLIEFSLTLFCVIQLLVSAKHQNQRLFFCNIIHMHKTTVKCRNPRMSNEKIMQILHRPHQLFMLFAKTSQNSGIVSIYTNWRYLHRKLYLRTSNFYNVNYKVFYVMRKFI